MVEFIIFSLLVLLYLIYTYFPDLLKGFAGSDFSPGIVKIKKCPSVEIKKCPPIIVYYKDNKYDITNFVKYHPGGKRILIENNGKDVEQQMLDNQHSEYAYSELEKYLIK